MDTPSKTAQLAVPPVASLLRRRAVLRHYFLVLLTGVISANLAYRLCVHLTEELKPSSRSRMTWIRRAVGVGFALSSQRSASPSPMSRTAPNRRNIIAGSLALVAPATLICGACGEFPSYLLLWRASPSASARRDHPPAFHDSPISTTQPRGGHGLCFLPCEYRRFCLALSCWRVVTAPRLARCVFAAGVPYVLLRCFLFSRCAEPPAGAHDIGPCATHTERPNGARNVAAFSSAGGPLCQMTIAAASVPSSSPTSQCRRPSHSRARA